MALSRRRILLLKKESTYGTDPTPTGGADAMLTSNLNITPYGGSTVSRNVDREFLGNDYSINVGAQVQVTFDVEIAGSTGAGVAPPYAPALQACGFGTETIAASTSVTYDLVSTGFDSVTMYFNIDGEQHIVTGARGNVSMSLSQGSIPVYSFSFTGLYADPTAVSIPTTTVTSFQTPLPVTNANTPTATLAAYDLILQSISFDLGNAIGYRNLVNNAVTGGEVVLTDRNVTGRMLVEAPTLAAHNFYTDVRSDNGVTTNALAITHGTTGGNIVSFNAPAVQVTSLDITESDGIKMYDLAFQCVPSSGNDELDIVVT